MGGVPQPFFNPEFEHELTSAGECTTFIAYGLAPVSVISPFGVFAIISNCIIPPLIFGENPTRRQLVGTALALPGVLLLILSSPDMPPEPQIIWNESVRMYAVGSLLLSMIVATGGSFARDDEPLRLLTDSILGALMGAYSVLTTKCLWLFLASKVQVVTPHMVLTFLVAITVTMLLQFAFLYDMLRAFAAWLVVAVHFSFFTIFVAIGSGIVFGEFRYRTDLTRLEFVVGCALIVIGVWVASLPPSLHKRTPERYIALHKRGATFRKPRPRKNKRKNRKTAKDGSMLTNAETKQAHSDVAKGPNPTSRTASPSTPNKNSVATSPNNSSVRTPNTAQRGRDGSRGRQLQRSESQQASQSQSELSQSQLIVPVVYDGADSDWVNFPDTSIDQQTYYLLPGRYLERRSKSNSQSRSRSRTRSSSNRRVNA